jgi:hypothetical protein
MAVLRAHGQITVIQLLRTHGNMLAGKKGIASIDYAQMVSRLGDIRKTQVPTATSKTRTTIKDRMGGLSSQMHSPTWA